MPKRVQLPDGSVGEFPDNMDDAAIEAVLQKQFPKQAEEKPSATYRAVSSFGSAIGAPQNVGDYLSGPAYALRHPIDSAKLLYNNAAQSQQDLIDKAYQYQHSPGIANKAKGFIYGLYSAIPVVGPTLAHAGEQFGTGDIAGGLGTTAGVAAPIVAGEVGPQLRANAQLPAKAQSVLQAKASDLYQGGLKPSTSPRAPAPESLVKTGLENEIPISEAGKEKLKAKVDDVNSRISAALDQRPISPQSVVNSAAPIRQRYATQMTPAADLAIIDAKNQEFLDRFNSAPGTQGPLTAVPASDLQAMKVGTYKILGKKYGQIGSTETEAQKGLALGAKEELNKAFPELSDMNAEESSYLKLAPALDKAVARAGNRNWLSLGTGVLSGATKAITGSGTAAAGAAIMKALMDDPAFSSRLAISIYRAGKGKISLPAARARVAGFAASLAASASASNEAPDYQTSE